MTASKVAAESSSHEGSKLWTPIKMGSMELKHRVVLAPMTRNRGTPSKSDPGRYVANEMMAEHYAERTTAGGLLITEAIATSRRAGSSPGSPAIETEEQKEGWKKVVEAVHEKQGVFVAQLWDQGRGALKHLTGVTAWSPSGIAITGNAMDGTPYEEVKEMTVDDIQEMQAAYVRSALAAMDCGFDGVEVHAANGYAPDQFHHSNVNKRTDSYGGSYEKRCKFTLELTDKLCDAVGASKVAVRLAPFGMFNQTDGEEREVQWTYLCAELAKRKLAYIHLVEPRFDELRSEAEKLSTLGGEEKSQFSVLSLQPYREAINGRVPLIVAGGYTWKNCWDGIEAGEHDAIAFGRWFTSNPDLVSRLGSQKPFYKYDRSRFYGPFEDNALGYVKLEAMERKLGDMSDFGSAQLAANPAIIV